MPTAGRRCRRCVRRSRICVGARQDATAMQWRTSGFAGLSRVPAVGWPFSASGRGSLSAVRVEVAELQVAVGQGVQPYGAKESFGGLYQQYCPGESTVVEAAAEMHARLDGDDL